MKGIVLLLLAMAILSLSANAISVVSDYLVNDTLELAAGASKIYSIRLQNPTENEAGMKLDYDATFMKVISYQDVYILPPKTTGYRIEFNITAPEKPGLYRLSYTVSEVSPGGGGTLPILLKINRGFKLKATKNPNKFYINYDYLAYAVIVLLLVYFFWKKKHGKLLNTKPKKYLKGKNL